MKKIIFILSFLIFSISTTTNSFASPLPPQGIFTLSTEGVNVDKLTFPNYVSGYSLRIRWSELETSTGNYNFTKISDTIEFLQKRNLSLNLEILSNSAPQYVIKNASKTFKIKFGRTVFDAPVPWDSNALSSWERLMNTLADYPVYDKVSGKSIALRDHPTLVSVDAPIVGMQGLRDIDRHIVGLKEYNRDLFINSVIRSVNASRKAFSKDFGYMAFFRIDDQKDPSKPLDKAVFEKLNSTFMQQTGLGLGLMQELWSDEGPKTDGLGLYLAKLKYPNAIMLQALTSWTKPFTGFDAVASGTPEIGFENAYKNYNARYYEMYYPDVINPKFATIFQKWFPIVTKKQ